MTFKRPDHVWLPEEVDKKGKELHARMAIYIDYYKYKPRDQRDDALIFEYIYHICYMLACKYKMFQTASDYDQFAIYCAGVVWGRIVNEKQFIAESGEELMPRIGSILNYIKASLLGMKVSYQKNEFQYVFDSELGFNGVKYINSVKESINSSYTNEYLVEDMIHSFKKLPYEVKKVVDTTPYCSDPVMNRRLYLSCMLSFANSLILNNKAKEKIAKKEEKGQDSDEFKINYYLNNDDKDVILWRVDEKLYDYVDILVKRVKSKIASDIGAIKKYHEMPDDILTEIMNSPLSEYTNHNKEDY